MNNRLGFIGTGSMGSILIEAFINSEAVQAKHVTISNRTMSKALSLSERYPGINVVQQADQVVRQSHIIFICVKPLEYQHVISTIKHSVKPEHIIVSITSPVFIQQLEDQLPCKIAKVVPSITNYVNSGASLCMYGQRMTEGDRARLEQLLSFISEPTIISEHDTRISSDLSSCGPAFISYFLERFIQAAVEETGIPSSLATHLASQMLLGTGQLLTSGQFTPTSLQQRVSVPGGITAEGLQMMSQQLDGMFNRLFQATHAKYDEDIVKVTASFNQRQG